MSARLRWGLTGAALFAVTLVEILVGRTWNGPIGLTIPLAALAVLPVAAVPAAPLVAVLVPCATLTAVSVALGTPQSTASIVAILLLGFAAGARLTGARLGVAALAVLVTPLVAITRTSAGSPPPNAIAFVFVVLLYTVPLGLGVLVRNRGRAAEAAREAADAAVRQQVLLAALAVRDERDRVAAELQQVVTRAVERLRVAAVDGRARVRDDPEAALAAFATVEATGQQALEVMRQVLRLLRTADDVATSVPAPALAQLPELLASAAAGGLTTDLAVLGRARPLPETVELVAYRVAEAALADAQAVASGARLEVDYRDDALVVRVSSSHGARAADAAIAALRQRAELIGGTVEAGMEGSRWAVAVELPVPA